MKIEISVSNVCMSHKVQFPYPQIDFGCSVADTIYLDLGVNTRIVLDREALKLLKSTIDEYLEKARI